MDQLRGEILTVPRDSESVYIKLRRIAEKAGTDRDLKFTSLYHLMNEELLRNCFENLGV